MSTVTTGYDSSTQRWLLRGGLRKLYDDTLGKTKTYYQEISNTITTKNMIETDLQKGTLDLPVEIVEGQNIPIQRPYLGNTKNYTQRAFAMGFRMTFMMDFFNKYHLYEDLSKSMAKRMKEGKDVEIATFWNGLTSQSLTCGVPFDTAAVASASHTGLNPNTTNDSFSNYLNANLSHAALLSMRYYFATKKDSMGQLNPGKATHLIYESTNWATVKEFLESELKSGEASNTKNVYGDLGLKPFEYPRFTSPTSCVAIQKDEDYDFNVLTSLEPKMFFPEAKDYTLDKVALSFQMFSFGAGDVRNIYVIDT